MNKGFFVRFLVGVPPKEPSRKPSNNKASQVVEVVFTSDNSCKNILAAQALLTKEATNNVENNHTATA